MDVYFMARALFHNRISKLNWYLWYNKLCTLPILSASGYLLNLLPVAIGEHELDSELCLFLTNNTNFMNFIMTQNHNVICRISHKDIIMTFWFPKQKVMLSLILHKLYNTGSFMSTMHKCYTFMILFEIQCHCIFILKRAWDLEIYFW